jgi:hypothetical protein
MDVGEALELYGVAVTFIVCFAALILFGWWWERER